MITDAHVHCSPEISPAALSDFLAETGTDRAVIQAVSHSVCISLIPTALEMKRLAPDRFWVFGAPDRRAYFSAGDNLGRAQRDYVRDMVSLGMDGVKLLEGKPQMRKALPVPDFDAPCWEPFWEYLEENRLPVMWHVNDPETNWGKNASPWLISQGWAYDDSFINNEEQYRQVLEVLKRHPNLRVVFAHFFFMSAQLDRLSDILDSFPDIMIDLTPGIEMYENFSAAPEQAAQFFDRYQDRICYGTDIGGRCILTNEGQPFNREECLRRPEIVRSFLSGRDEQLICSDGNFLIDRKSFVMKPLGLPDSVLEKILNGNIVRQIGHTPSAIPE